MGLMKSVLWSDFKVDWKEIKTVMVTHLWKEEHVLLINIILVLPLDSDSYGNQSHKWKLGYKKEEFTYTFNFHW